MKLAVLSSVIGILMCVGAQAAETKAAQGEKSGFVTASDGAKIHYIEAGQPGAVGGFQAGGQPAPGAIAKGKVSLSNLRRGPSILFVPGWTMPAWIWQRQIEYFSSRFRVVAMDPRCQGESSRIADGLYPAQMARDIKSVIDELRLARVVLVGWSMAVVETMAYVDQFGTHDLAGLVLVDDIAGGLGPGEAAEDIGLMKGVLEDRKGTADFFVRKIQFHKPQPEEYIRRLIASSLSVPTNSAVALLVGRYAADYNALLPKVDRPTLVCAASKTPYFDRIRAMQKQIPGSRLEVFEGAGHALFVDDPDEFNTALGSFLDSLE
ncbi:MAG TPA: alpha/beta hydrolase [Candidatus Cybelea sp.]|nr:alpha/beta hydrolase [Candidatus Cybelea sp.]